MKLLIHHGARTVHLPQLPKKTADRAVYRPAIRGRWRDSRTPQRIPR
jgi:hypothetical protein